MCLAATAGFVTAGGQLARPNRNPEAQKIKNPVERTTASIDAGRKLYVFYCAFCHGPYGKGDGGVYGAFGGGSPTNFVDNAWQSTVTDGEIFVAIQDGLAVIEMSAFKKKITEPQTWDLVNYLRSIGEKSAAQ